MRPTSDIRTSASARLPIVAGLLALLCALCLWLAPARSAAGPIPPPRTAGEAPSFVVIQTDDQTLDSLYATFQTFPGAGETRAMPNTLDLIAKKGMTFNRYYVPYPLCCPSRVSLLTGRYAHSHNVKGNVQPNGGFLGFSFRGAMQHNLAVWLQAAGYRTIHVGKFLNGYGDEPYSTGLEVAPGWSAWYSIPESDTTHYYYGYKLNVNGQILGPVGDPGSWESREYTVRDDFGCPFAPANGLPCNYATDKLTEIASNEMFATPAEQPFFVQLDYTAPHGDFRRPAGPEPAPRHYDWFRGDQLPHNRSEGLDEGNVTDKPRFIRDAPHLTPNEKRTYRVYWQKQLESLRGVDDGVKRIIDTLGAMGRLRNTYVLFTSDNGFFFGEHRLLGGKFLAYEPATHMPFLIRGPGIKPDSSTGELVANIDIAPTLLQLAGATATKSIDGRSLVPYMEDPELRSRRPILFESFVETSDVEAGGAVPEEGAEAAGASGARHSSASGARASASGPKATASLLAPPKDYAGIRLGPYKYIAWPTGEKELYNINRDPHELNSLHKVPNFFPIRNFLHRQMKRLIDCTGSVCSEVTPKLPLTRVEFQRLQAQKQREVREREREREKARRERERGR
ncbi:MAG TPA: sulfatase [Solirubrobacterales bacterium]|nr:sulfatase [Solirubrobacterales bacterium]